MFQPSASQIVTLTSDFGLCDPWVAEFKAAILGVAADLTLIDISHSITAFHIPQAAYLVHTACRRFPAGTIHVVGVDPHPTDRGLLLLLADQVFIGPDNGVFTPLLDADDTESKSPRGFQLDQPQYWGHPHPTTFRARDVFGPVAGHLTRGVTPGQLGSPTTLDARKPTDSRSRSTPGPAGEVVHVDRFGNLITGIPGTGLAQDTVVQIGDHRISGLSRTFDDPVGDQPLLALVGSNGYLEICLPRGSAAQLTGLGQGTPVTIRGGTRRSDTGQA